MPKKILSINANRSMNFLLHTFLSSKYDVITTTDTIDGMKALKRKKNIELLIIDVDYSTTENLDFVSYIQSSLFDGSPIIVLTSRIDLLERFENNHQFMVFMKPFSPVKLMNSIDQLVAALPAFA